MTKAAHVCLSSPHLVTQEFESIQKVLAINWIALPGLRLRVDAFERKFVGLFGRQVTDYGRSRAGGRGERGLLIADERGDRRVKATLEIADETFASLIRSRDEFGAEMRLAVAMNWLLGKISRLSLLVKLAERVAIPYGEVFATTVVPQMIPHGFVWRRNAEILQPNPHPLTEESWPRFWERENRH